MKEYGRPADGSYLREYVDGSPLVRSEIPSLERAHETAQPGIQGACSIDAYILPFDFMLIGSAP